MFEDEHTVALELVLYIVVTRHGLDHRFAALSQLGDFFAQFGRVAPGGTNGVLALGRRQQAGQFAQVEREARRRTRAAERAVTPGLIGFGVVAAAATDRRAVAAIVELLRNVRRVDACLSLMSASFL